MSSQRNTPGAFTNRKRQEDVAAFRDRITYGHPGRYGLSRTSFQDPSAAMNNNVDNASTSYALYVINARQTPEVETCFFYTMRLRVCACVCICDLDLVWGRVVLRPFYDTDEPRVFLV